MLCNVTLPTVGRVYLVEQIECSIAEGSSIHVDTYGIVLFVVLDFKKWNI